MPREYLKRMRNLSIQTLLDDFDRFMLCVKLCKKHGLPDDFPRILVNNVAREIKFRLKREKRYNISANRLIYFNNAYR